MANLDETYGSISREPGIFIPGTLQRVVMGRNWTGYWVRFQDESGGNPSYLSRNPDLSREQAAHILDEVSKALDLLDSAGEDAGCIFRVEVQRY